MMGPSARGSNWKQHTKNIQYQLADEYSINGYYEKTCEALEKIYGMIPARRSRNADYSDEAAGRRSYLKLLKFFKRYVKILKDELGILPSEKLMKLLPKDSIEWRPGKID